MSDSKTTVESMTPAEVTAFNRHLREIATNSRKAAGLIVVCSKGNDAVGFWDGEIAETFDPERGEFPYVYVSVKAAQKRANALNEDYYYSAWGQWQVAFWKHPDYYMDTQLPIGRYLQMTGSRFEGSPRQ